MKKSSISFLLFLSFHLLLGQDAKTVWGEVLVKLDSHCEPSMLVQEVNSAIGILPDFKLSRAISESMDIYLFSFEEALFNKNELIRYLNNLEKVIVAQPNHVIENRIVPNDPFFGLQWHHEDPEDNDIDSELAWAITTGGLTANGDEIVVCVIETQGSKWNHPELVDNHWLNSNEIAANGIDDDNNDYIDDKNGWNIQDNNDIINNGDHGTKVSSMIGAKGDNGTGISGVNWNIKIMQVQMGGVSEANAIEAYEYPLKMRKLYNQSNGVQGAFVVATNSSWGTDGGQADDAPLWCAMYDSLGVHGILSCGATSNSNVNVDVVGDLPTGCPSEFLISITATDNQDVRDFAGYGLNSIDLGAPGDLVYLAGNSTYGSFYGTSFATPCVTGAIGLLYSAPCSNFIAISQTSPSTGASMVKEFIMEGADPVDNLNGYCVSGGRLNLNNSLQLIMESCEGGTCIAPFLIMTSPIAGSLSQIVSWQSTSTDQNFSLRYRILGEIVWQEIIGITDLSIQLNTLLACSVYELQLKTFCLDGSSDWSDVVLFESNGCCISPSAFVVSDISSTNVTVNWNSVLAAQSYDVMLFIGNDLVSQNQNILDNTITYNDLIPCTNYTLQISSNCVDSPSPLTISINTVGCSDCSSINYCTISSDSESEFIANVTLGDINNSSEDDGGYVFVTNASTTLVAGQVYPISCTPGFNGFVYNEFFKVWIDYNSNGIFEENSELVFESPNSSSTASSGSFIVPTTIVDGMVRMRVGMSYLGQFSGEEPVACGSFDFGETEDYCVMLDGTVAINETNIEHFVIAPNPMIDFVQLLNDKIVDNRKITLYFYNSLGALVKEVSVVARDRVDVSNLAQGLYTVSYFDKGYLYNFKLLKQ